MEEMVEDHPKFSTVFRGARQRLFHKMLDNCP